MMEVLDVSFGSNLPILDNWKLLQSSPEGIVVSSTPFRSIQFYQKALCDGKYYGGFEIKLKVVIQIHLPPLNPRLIPIVGTIHVESLSGQVVTNY